METLKRGLLPPRSLLSLCLSARLAQRQQRVSRIASTSVALGLECLRGHGRAYMMPVALASSLVPSSYDRTLPLLRDAWMGFKQLSLNTVAMTVFPLRRRHIMPRSAQQRNDHCELVCYIYAYYQVTRKQEREARLTEMEK
jgi:hypothetical protein